MSATFDPPLSLDETNNLFANLSITDVINPGGQGAVFRAISKCNTPLFLKIYYPQLTIRAEREVEKLKKLTSDFFVQLIDYGFVEVRDQQCFYSVTEYIEGETLREIINRKKLNDKEMSELIIAMGKAIDELWSHDIVHRDIKPENIMQTEVSYKLIDLGIAKHHDLNTITQSGVALGTLPYMSPEQIQARKNLTLRTDLFALGIVLYEAYTGKHPFGHNPLIIGKINPTPIKSINPEADKTIVEIINKLLKPKAIERPFSGEEIIDYLIGGN